MKSACALDAVPNAQSCSSLRGSSETAGGRCRTRPVSSLTTVASDSARKRPASSSCSSVPSVTIRCSSNTVSGVSGASSRTRSHSIARKLLTIIRSLWFTGSRPSRSIALAASRVVDAPSSWLEVIASSKRDDMRYRSRVPGSVTCDGVRSAPAASRSIRCRRSFNSGTLAYLNGRPRVSTSPNSR